MNITTQQFLYATRFDAGSRAGTPAKTVLPVGLGHDDAAPLQPQRPCPGSEEAGRLL